MLAAQDSRPVHTVSTLAREARLLIEERFDLVWVEGEISNFRRPSSGHWYFTLKDDGAQLRCCMFAGRNRSVRFAARDGAQVMLRGRLSLYEARGDFQLIAEHMEPAGEGVLKAAFEALKIRLDAEGLFAAERKRALPTLPRHLAVISSATGAALRDVLHVIQRRYPPLRVTVLPVAVQGERAEGELLRALGRVPALGADVVLITRGGGSLEDLWAFNLEAVARAVAACPVPTVSAIGHQTDFTITDFVADLRAPTPSAGAELITPDRIELDARLRHGEARLTRALTGELRGHERQVQHLRARLTDPRARLQQQMQRADELDGRLQRAMARRIAQQQGALDARHRQLLLLRPERLIARHQTHLSALRSSLASCQARLLTNRRDALAGAARTLQAVSPLATLGRGYAVVSRADGAVRTPISSIRDTARGELLTAHLADGALRLRVEDLDDDNHLPRLPTLDGGREDA